MKYKRLHICTTKLKFPVWESYKIAFPGTCTLDSVVEVMSLFDKTLRVVDLTLLILVIR